MAVQALQAPFQSPRVAVASLALYYPGSVLVARPLKELYAYIQDCELPPLSLIARVIKTLVLSVFRWHLCDHVLLAKRGGIFHSLQGRLEVASLDELARSYPKLFRSCFVLIYNNKAKADFTKPERHPHIDHYLGNHTFGRDAVFPYTAINPQTIADYYQNFYGIPLTDNRTGCTISKMFDSRFLRNETDNSVIKLNFNYLHEINTHGRR